MNFSHLSDGGLLIHLSLPVKLVMSWLLDQVAKLGREAAAGPRCEGLGALPQAVRVAQLWRPGLWQPPKPTGPMRWKAPLSLIAGLIPANSGLCRAEQCLV